MEATAASLFWIALCAVVAPLLAGVVPRRLVPEVVLLLVFGVIIGRCSRWTASNQTQPCSPNPLLARCMESKRSASVQAVALWCWAPA